MASGKKMRSSGRHTTKLMATSDEMTSPTTKPSPASLKGHAQRIEYHAAIGAGLGEQCSGLAARREGLAYERIDIKASGIRTGLTSDPAMEKNGRARQLTMVYGVGGRGCAGGVQSTKRARPRPPPPPATVPRRGRRRRRAVRGRRNVEAARTSRPRAPGCAGPMRRWGGGGAAGGGCGGRRRAAPPLLAPEPLADQSTRRRRRGAGMRRPAKMAGVRLVPGRGPRQRGERRSSDRSTSEKHGAIG